MRWRQKSGTTDPSTFVTRDSTVSKSTVCEEHSTKRDQPTKANWASLRQEDVIHHAPGNGRDLMRLHARSVMCHLRADERCRVPEREVEKVLRRAQVTFGRL